jgi:hypothetical protein
MGLDFDDKNTIREAKRDDYISHLMRLATEGDNRNGSVILKKAGLSGRVDKYSEELSPFSFHLKYRNPNDLFAPEMVFDEIYSEIGQNDKERQYVFLKAIVEQIPKIDKHGYELETFNRYLALLGYLIVKTSDSETNGYTLQTIEVSALSDGSDYSRFEFLAEQVSHVSMVHYNEAVSTFRNGDYGSCVAECRKFLEAIVTAITKVDDTGKAIFVLSKEGFSDSTEKVSDLNQAVNYWARKRDKVCRFMRIYTLYNSLCGFGSHSDIIPDMNDALWLLHETQSSVFWILGRH